MRTLDLKKIVCTLAFIGLAGFSCFWTAESLLIWQPSITIYGAWLIALVFYIVASLCFTNVLKALDRNEYFGRKLGGRGGQLLFGLLGLIVFWLIVSLPTNTHTLLYRASIKGVIKSDLTRTQSYLQGLKENNVEIKKVEERYNSRKEAVDAQILRLVAEIKNPSALGIGHRFETILVELQNTLGTQIQRVANVGNTPSQWLTAVNYYQAQAYEQLKLYRAECDKEIKKIMDLMKSEQLDNLIRNCGIALNDIDRMDGIDNNIIATATKDLMNGYAFIKANARYIDFKNSVDGAKDEMRYTREGAMPEAQEMLSVDKVWKDYLTTDKYQGHGFIWWVLIALLVDLAAFIFFNLAFNRDNNNAI